MSYEEILEKIRKARMLAESKKKAHLAEGETPVKSSKPPSKEEIVWEDDSLTDHRASVQQWRKPSDLA